MRTYITVQGDMWDKIAHKEMGSTSYTDVLMTANQTHIGTFIFPEGIDLVIPDVAADVSSALPPWKEVMG